MTFGNVKIWTAFVIGIMLAAGFSGLMVYGLEDGSAGPDVYIEPGSGVETASYIIYKDGDYGCVKNGTTGRIEYRSDNMTNVFQYALDIGGDILVREASYEITAGLELFNDTKLRSTGAVIYSETPDIELLKTKPILSDNFGSGGVDLTDSYNGSLLITTSAPHDYSVGEYVYVISDALYYGISGILYGEAKKITGVSGNNIYLDAPLMYDYLVSDNARIYKFEMKHNISIDGFIMIGPSQTDASKCAAIYNTQDLTISNCRISNFGRDGLELHAVRDSLIENVYIYGAKKTGYGYGVAFVGACYNINVYNSIFEYCRHGHTTGQLAYGGVPSYIKFSSCSFINTEQERPHEMGTHLTYESTQFFNTSVSIENSYVTYQGCSFALKNGGVIGIGSKTWQTHVDHLVMRDCVVSGTSVSLLQIANVERASIDGCSIDHFYATPVSGYAIDIYPLTGAGLPANEVTDLTIQNTVITSNSNAIRVYGTVSTQNVTRLNLIGNEINSAKSGILLNNIQAENSVMRENVVTSTENALYLQKYNAATVDGNHIISSQIGIYTLPGSSNTTISRNTIYAGGTSLPAIYLYSNSGTKSRIIVSENQIFSLGNYYGLRARGINNATITSNVFFNNNTNHAILCESDSADIRMDNNILSRSNGAAGTINDAGKRNTINGVGVNGENDPASAGNWAGFGYEGVFVKWNAGATHYLSVYRGGAWYDMTLA